MIQRIGGISHLEACQDFYEAGFTSVLALPLLIEIEERFQISVPDGEFVNARTPQALEQLIASLERG